MTGPRFELRTLSGEPMTWDELRDLHERWRAGEFAARAVRSTLCSYYYHERCRGFAATGKRCCCDCHEEAA